MSWTSERARLAALHRYRSPDDPDITRARAALAVAHAEFVISRVIATAPPLGAQAVSRIRALISAPVEGVASDGRKH